MQPLSIPRYRNPSGPCLTHRTRQFFSTKSRSSLTTLLFSITNLLRCFNVHVSNDRVVIDRNRITGGGVTSGIDFALMLASILFGEERAKEIQLLIEYNPQPPFRSGHPDVAEESLVRRVREERELSQKKRLEEIENFILNSKLNSNFPADDK